ncbi:hypothetical protein M413DRAFT_442083 [Hebeloma cylindrosporum]|uniref:Uncharacterized protein n=1 Tax=Hebeloma cylindrosporum TaxID=76867 RepID=A0A0C3CNK8_HEBCY|nr:hypothetical protein M413DRAFT_442083 [Hebeloma cylindrosporum h7]
MLLYLSDVKPHGILYDVLQQCNLGSERRLRLSSVNPVPSTNSAYREHTLNTNIVLPWETPSGSISFVGMLHVTYEEKARKNTSRQGPCICISFAHFMALKATWRHFDCGYPWEIFITLVGVVHH